MKLLALHRSREICNLLGVCDSTFRNWQKVILPQQRSKFTGPEVCLFLILAHGIQHEGLSLKEHENLNWLDLKKYIQQQSLPELKNMQVIVDTGSEQFHLAPATQIFQFEYDLSLYTVHFEALFWMGMVGRFMGKQGHTDLSQVNLAAPLKQFIV